jgi:hypothetical protein
MGANLTSKITDHLKQKETLYSHFVTKNKETSEARRASNRIKEPPIIAQDYNQKPTIPILSATKHI